MLIVAALTSICLLQQMFITVACVKCALSANRGERRVWDEGRCKEKSKSRHSLAGHIRSWVYVESAQCTERSLAFHLRYSGMHQLVYVSDLFRWKEFMVAFCQGLSCTARKILNRFKNLGCWEVICIVLQSGLYGDSFTSKISKAESMHRMEDIIASLPGPK